jgi:hypothetical protein
VLTLKTLSTLHFSQFGIVEKFLFDENLGIKKYFLGLQAAEPDGGEGNKKAAHILQAAE